MPFAPLTDARGCGWAFDGNEERPTLSPSINCNVQDAHGNPLACGWHGFMKDGKLTDG